MSAVDRWLRDHTDEWADARELAELALLDGVYDDTFVQEAALDRATADIRKRLKKRGRGGVPAFGNLRVDGPDGTIRQRYKALQFFDDTDFRVLIGDHIQRAGRELKIAGALEAERSERFGDQLPIPELVFAEG